MANVKGNPFFIIGGALSGDLSVEEILNSNFDDDLASLIEARRVRGRMFRYGFSEDFLSDAMLAAKQNYGVRDLILLWRDADTADERAKITKDLRELIREVLR